MPAGLDGIELMVELKMGGNRLKRIPTQFFAKWKALKELYLARNELVEIPSSLAACAQLEILDIRQVSVARGGFALG